MIGRWRSGRPVDAARCVACADFRNGAREIERAIPGLASLSSGDAAVRSDDGLCLRHSRFTGARQCCPAFRPATR